jgi:PPOX class probable F420-dependent enzyme
MASEAELLELIATHRQAVLTTLRKDGRPQLSNVFYIWDAEQRVARISTTAVRAKARNLRRDPRAALYVPGDHFWSYVVADATAELRGPTTAPGDEAGRELLTVHSAFYGGLEEEPFFAEMIAAQRLVIRLSVSHVYGLALEHPPAG